MVSFKKAIKSARKYLGTFKSNFKVAVPIASVVRPNAAAAKQKLLISQNAAMQNFIGKLAEGTWRGKEISDGLLKLHQQQPSLTMSLASGLLNSKETFNVGLLSLIKIQYKRRLYPYVSDLCAKYPLAELINDAYEEAVSSHSAVNSPQCERVIQAYLKTLPKKLDTNQLDTIAKCRNLTASLQALVNTKNTKVLGELLQKLPEAEANYQIDPTLFSAKAQAEDWLRKIQLTLPKSKSKHEARIGFLSYYSPLKPSTNIGDYVQTIAMIGQMSRSLPENIQVHGGGQEIFDRISKRVKRRSNRHADAKVNAVWIDRDDPSTTPKGELIWLPVNGWFMHNKFLDQFDFPFASNVRPFFIGMHINQPQMLTKAAVDYLKKYEPIGTRDFHTARLLTACGIDAFFSGCPTLTLNTIFGRAAAAERAGEFYAAHNLTDAPGKNYQNRVHMDPKMPAQDVESGLQKAWEYLEGYAKAKDVITPLLHCYLPSRSFGTPVKFTSSKRNSDPRFKGLIGISDEEVSRIADGISRNVDFVMDSVLSGESEKDIYQQWKLHNAAAVESTKAMLAEQFPSTVEAHMVGDEETQSTVAQKTFLNGIEGGEPKAEKKFVEIVFCYDQHFDKPTFVTLRSILKNTKSQVRVTLLTRGVTQDRIKAISQKFAKTNFVWLDVTELQFKNLKLLRHTTLSTMDRLFLPQFLNYADRVVYLDIDIAVQGDIKELYNIDMAGCAIGARQTVFPGWSNGYSLCQLIEKQLTPKQTIKFRNEFLYGEHLGYGCFNAGVQVMDLNLLRKQQFTKRLLKIVQDYGVNDQFACNLFAAGNFKRLPNEWNHFATQEWIAKPKLIHYTGYIKPWDAEYCPKAEVWRSYIENGDALEMKSAIAKSWFK